MEARRAKTRRALCRGLVHDSRPPKGARKALDPPRLRCHRLKADSGRAQLRKLVGQRRAVRLHHAPDAPFEIIPAEAPRYRQGPSDLLNGSRSQPGQNVLVGLAASLVSVVYVESSNVLIVVVPA